MKIEFICPAAEDSAFLKSLAIANLAAVTPSEIQISLKDDIIDPIDPKKDLDFNADLAALTVSTKTAHRAYQLADAYRRRGVKVVLGGIHPTLLPEEALMHGDAVVVGEAEEIWPTVLNDAKANRLKRVYHPVSPSCFAPDFIPRWDIFRSLKYIPVYTVQATRGCPHRCEFCSVSSLMGRKVRKRPLPSLLKELERLDRRWVLFADDNIVASPLQAQKLFRAIAPLKLTWFAQASTSGLADPQTVKWIARSGCKALFIGFESLNVNSLKSAGKAHNDPSRYIELIHRLKDAGIAVWAAFVLGLDGEGPDVFERTLEFVQRAKPFVAQFALLTPFPGTRLYQRLEAQGRLLDKTWWLRKHDNDFPKFLPQKMSPEELYQGWQWTWRECYKGSAILKRFFGSVHSSVFSLLAYLPINFYLHRLTDAKILGGERFFWRDRATEKCSVTP